MNKIIYDIGVNNGQSSRHYLDMGHKVIGIEANFQKKYLKINMY